jgi:hypothetical protein
MSEWKDTDEVVTTYGSIQLSLEQSYSAGQKTEQERIIKLIEDAQNQTVHVIDKEAFESKTIKIICETIRADFLIALIKGETSE